MNLDLTLLRKAADVLHMKLYNPGCQSQLIDCFYVKQRVDLGRVVDCFNYWGGCLRKKKKCGKCGERNGEDPQSSL